METRRLLPALSGLALLFAASGARADVEVNRFTVNGFSASLNATATEACTYTELFVGGQENVLRDGGPSRPSSAAFISYWQYDYCAGTTTMGVGSSFEGVDFRGNFDRASLSNTTFLVETTTYPDDPWGEVTYGTQTATVSVDWAGTGAITAHSGGDNVNFGGVVIWNNRSAYQQRAASVTLDLSFDGVPASFDSVSGEMIRGSWASVLIWLPE